MLQARALAGQRQLVLLAGDPGLGKSTLLDHFAASLAGADGQCAVVACRGACLEQRSEHEPFAPVLAMLDDLCRGPLAGPASAALRRCAPTWLAQLPWLVQPHELDDLRRSLAGMGIGRMLREFGALLQALCSHTPLVLLIEDLHWADAASIDLLRLAATDRAPARLLVVASFQPALARLAGHPVTGLADQLPARGQASLLTLAPLADAEVAALVASRFDDAAIAARLQPWAQRQSGGNPLYLQAALDHLVDSGALVRQADGWQLHALPCADTPAGPLRSLIAAGLARLAPATLALLEAASVVGMQVPVPLLAAALQQPDAAVEQACHELAMQGLFLQAGGVQSWPDGTAAASWHFGHDLYRRALYDGLAPTQRQALHRRVALRLEAGWAGRLAPVAGQLAAAYAGAAMPEATARVLELAAQLSAQRFAYGESIAALQAALQQLQQSPDADDHDALALRIHLMLGNVALNHLGLGAPVVLTAFEHARAIALRSGAVRERIRAQLGATVVHTACFRPQAALQLALDTVALAEARQPSLAMVAHHYAGMACALNGDLAAARRHQEHALGLQPDPLVPLFIELHSSVTLHLGRMLCMMGEPAPGLALIERGLARSRECSTPADLVQKLFWAADTRRLLGDGRAADRLQEVVDLAATFDLPGLHGAGLVSLACLPHPAQRDTALIGRLFAVHGRPGDAQMALTVGIALAEAHLAQGDPAAAQAAWAQARAVTPAGALFEPDLLRLQARLQAATGAPAAAVDASFRAGLAVARAQQARLQGRRCALAWSRWLLRQGRRADAAEVLSAAPRIDGVSPGDGG